MRRSLTIVATFALATLALTAYQGTAMKETAEAVRAVPLYGHVFVLVGENKTLHQITSSGNDPYIMKTVKPNSAWFTGYNSVTIGSLADYIALTSGQYAACQRKGPCGRFDVPNIFAEATAAGVSWKDWNESMPSNCYGSKAGSLARWNYYKPGHNPSLFFTNLKAGSPSQCGRFDVPAGSTNPVDMSAFEAALARGTVPRYNFVTPNGCEAGYLSCYGYDGLAAPTRKVNPIREFDHFLHKEIPAIQQSPACAGGTPGNGCLIVVTFDEGGHTRGTSTMLAVMGPGVTKGSYGGYYDHYSTLRTVEKALGLGCTAHACGNAYTGPDGLTHHAVDLPIF